MASRKKPIFANRDPKEIEKKQNNGGLSENTKARRLGVLHYLKNKVGVVDFANAQGVVMF